MAPIPPYLVRLAASFLTEALTRKLATSPLFFRIVDRMIHEMDHVPHRLQGRQVPPYQAPLGMRETEWHQDIGEPHDEPNPFPTSTAAPHASSSPPRPPPQSFEEAQRTRARQSFVQAQRIAERSRQNQRDQAKRWDDDRAAQQLRELQQKLRELRDGGRRG